MKLLEVLIFSFLFLLFVLPAEVNAQAFKTPVEVHGYAWSSNIGWISFNCDNEGTCGTVDYKVEINPDGTITGYAWSSNIGWIKFGDLTGCPNGDCDARGNSSMNEIEGWARACWATANEDCTGGTNPFAAGWDGWISLNGSNHGASSYGVDIGQGTVSGYAWGSEVIGWVSFSGTGYEVTFDQPCSPSLTCNVQNTSYNTLSQWCDDQGPFYCAANEDCLDSQGCIANVAEGTLSVDRTLVRPGATVNLSWSVSSGDASSCTVEGTNGDSWTGLSSGGASGSVESSPLNRQTTIFRLRCVPAGGGSSAVVDTVRVQLTSAIIES